MFSHDQYQLLDFGGGRKLERFGGEVLDRPSPAAVGATATNPEIWGSATARFDIDKGAKGSWTGELSSSDESWSVSHGASRLIMGLNSSGNVGLFPEQAANWDWISEHVEHSRTSLTNRRPRVLNLFAYTGGATLAAAAAGAEVSHVDSSGPTVAWARKNAEASGMVDLPIRWLVEDAIKFAAREVKRGNFYDGVIVDPPTYGHGPKGKAFKFQQHVGELMRLCGALISERPYGHRFLLFSCHAPRFGPEDAAFAVSASVPAEMTGNVVSLPLSLQTEDGPKLAAGVCAQWSTTVRE